MLESVIYSKNKTSIFEEDMKNFTLQNYSFYVCILFKCTQVLINLAFYILNIYAIYQVSYKLVNTLKSP